MNQTCFQINMWIHTESGGGSMSSVNPAISNCNVWLAELVEFSLYQSHQKQPANVAEMLGLAWNYQNTEHIEHT